MVGAVLGIVQAGIGIYGLINSSKDKDKGAPQEAPELRSAYQRALEQSEYGYEAQQKKALEQKIAQESTTAYRRGVSMGGGSLAGAVRSGINAMQLDARNEMAMNDASLKMQKQAPVYSLAGQIQAQGNAKSSFYAQQYAQEQQAFGGALQAGTQSLGNAMNQNKYMDFMKDMYGQNGGANTPQMGDSGVDSGIPTLTGGSQAPIIGDGADAGGIASPSDFMLTPDNGFMGGGFQYSNIGGGNNQIAPNQMWGGEQTPNYMGLQNPNMFQNYSLNNPLKYQYFH